MKRRAVRKRFPFWQLLAAILVLIIAGYLFIHIQEQRADAVFEAQAASIETALQRLAPLPPASEAIKVPIFIYHSVRPHIPGEDALQDEYDVTPELLEQQLKYLQDNGYTPITPDDLAAFLKEGDTGPVKKPVMLTFDDGWQNEFTYAFPLLKKYGMKATFYVYTNPISKQPHYLTWDEIKEMDAAGMTIGSHTLSHPYLKGLSDAQLTQELTQSKKILEEHLGKPIIHFASPFGYSDEHIRTAIKAAGYETARTTYRSSYESDPFRLTGYIVSDNMQDFIHELNTPQ